MSSTPSLWEIPTPGPCGLSGAAPVHLGLMSKARPTPSHRCPEWRWGLRLPVSSIVTVRGHSSVCWAELRHMETGERLDRALSEAGWITKILFLLGGVLEAKELSRGRL